MSRHLCIAALSALIAAPTFGAVQAPARAAARAPIVLNFDYSAVDALLQAIRQKRVSDTQLNHLVAIKGIRATIQNTIKYLPKDNLAGFRAAIRQVEATGKETTGNYQLDDVFAHRKEIRVLLEAIRRVEPALTGDIVHTLLTYAPAVRGLTITVYFVAGGVSDGFLLDNDPKSEFFVALGKGDQDIPGLKLDITHEAFHAVQRNLGKSAPGMKRCVADPNGGSVTQRLLCTTLLEGTASYVADPTRMAGSGPYVGMWRARFVRNLKPARLKGDFEQFERAFAQLRDGSISWRAAYAGLFTPPDTPGYFVGYEMTRAIVKYKGAPAVGGLFNASPAAFFKEYIALYEAHPQLAYHFSKPLERIIETAR
jgi:hypothetical protein